MSVQPPAAPHRVAIADIDIPFWRMVAIISPVEESVDVGWACRLVAQGRARWSGGKPIGTPRPVRITMERTVSNAVLEDRR